MIKYFYVNNFLCHTGRHAIDLDLAHDNGTIYKSIGICGHGATGKSTILRLIRNFFSLFYDYNISLFNYANQDEPIRYYIGFIIDDILFTYQLHISIKERTQILLERLSYVINNNFTDIYDSEFDILSVDDLNKLEDINNPKIIDGKYNENYREPFNKAKIKFNEKSAKDLGIFNILSDMTIGDQSPILSRIFSHVDRDENNIFHKIGKYFKHCHYSEHKMIYHKEAYDRYLKILASEYGSFKDIASNIPGKLGYSSSEAFLLEITKPISYALSTGSLCIIDDIDYLVDNNIIKKIFELFNSSNNGAQLIAAGNNVGMAVDNTYNYANLYFCERTSNIKSFYLVRNRYQTSLGGDIYIDENKQKIILESYYANKQNTKLLDLIYSGFDYINRNI